MLALHLISSVLQGSSCGEEQPVPVESGADCTYKGDGYSLFERFKDDCNMCMCLRGGTVTCTKNKCFVAAKSCTFQVSLIIAALNVTSKCQSIERSLHKKFT